MRACLYRTAPFGKLAPGDFVTFLRKNSRRQVGRVTPLRAASAILILTSLLFQLSAFTLQPSESIVNPNYQAASRAAVASRRFLHVESKTAGKTRRLPSATAPRHCVSSPSLVALLTYFGAHIALGIAMKQLPALATAHAWLSFVVALYWAGSANGSNKVIPAICYLMGAEVLWRMTNADVFWEFGKYSICALALVSYRHRRPPQFNGLALLYFGLLLPSTLLTILGGYELSSVRNMISFNLSGPLALAVCAFCFSGLRLRTVTANHILLAILGPLAGAATVCLVGTVNLGAAYEFGNESNFDTSGGYGPNQVSSMFGLAMLVGYLWMQRQPRLSAHWWFAAVLLLWFALQATVTFSRTGLWLGIITIGIAAFFLMGKSTKALPGTIGALLVLAFVFYICFGFLDQFTDGKLSQRYAEKGFTRREDIARGDLILALHHPILGVGVGRVGAERVKLLGLHGMAHTEFTRMLAEHGSTGLLALGVLLVMAVKACTYAAPEPTQRAWTSSLIAFSFLFMMVSGTRLAASAVVMGLALVRLVTDPSNLRRIIQASSISRRI